MSGADEFELDPYIQMIRAAFGHSSTPEADAVIAKAQAQDETKRLAKLRARCALQGVQLLVTTDDRGGPLYVGTKWALCRHMSSLDELAEWVRLIDGQKE